MYSRNKKVFIGKDISRTASLVVFPYLGGTITEDNIADGEVAVLDKNRNPLTLGSTVNDTDTIYIAEALSTTMTYANEAGTAITARKILLSEPIRGAYVRSYSAKAFTVKAEKTATTGYLITAPTVGDEYVLRIVYKDVKEHPGQKTQTYRIVVTTATDTNTEIITKFVALINSDPEARVTAATSGSSTTQFMIITGKAIPECTTSLNDIDAFQMVDFEVFFYWIDQTASGYHGLGPFNEVAMSADVTYTGPTYGNGNWEQVRDAEKSVLGTQFGVTNRIWFPVRQPDFRTVKSETYDTLVIEHDAMIQTPDNGYQKLTRKATQVFIPNNASANQWDTIISLLNPWMASLPAAFANITI